MATSTPTPSPTVTPTVTNTPSNTASQTPTPSTTAYSTPTPSPSVTPTLTPTQTTSPTPTITPSQFGVISANTFYEYTNEMEGSFSGGTWDSSLGNVPHPVNQSMTGVARGITIEMSAVALGGFDGLNN